MSKLNHIREDIVGALLTLESDILSPEEKVEEVTKILEETYNYIYETKRVNKAVK